MSTTLMKSNKSNKTQKTLIHGKDRANLLLIRLISKDRFLPVYEFKKLLLNDPFQLFQEDFKGDFYVFHHVARPANPDNQDLVTEYLAVVKEVMEETQWKELCLLCSNKLGKTALYTVVFFGSDDSLDFMLQHGYPCEGPNPSVFTAYLSHHTIPTQKKVHILCKYPEVMRSIASFAFSSSTTKTKIHSRSLEWILEKHNKFPQVLTIKSEDEVVSNNDTFFPPLQGYPGLLGSSSTISSNHPSQNVWTGPLWSRFPSSSSGHISFATTTKDDEDEDEDEDDFNLSTLSLSCSSSLSVFTGEEEEEEDDKDDEGNNTVNLSPIDKNMVKGREGADKSQFDVNLLINALFKIHTEVIMGAESSGSSVQSVKMYMNTMATPIFEELFKRGFSYVPY